jgi:hypothetical protein
MRGHSTVDKFRPLGYDTVSCGKLLTLQRNILPSPQVYPETRYSTFLRNGLNNYQMLQFITHEITKQKPCLLWLQYRSCALQVTNTPHPELRNCRPTSRQVLHVFRLSRRHNCMKPSRADRRVNFLKTSDVSETHSVCILRESDLSRSLSLRMETECVSETSEVFI